MLIVSFSPGSTTGERLEPSEEADALSNIPTRSKSSSPHSLASSEESLEAQKRDVATSPSDNQSSEAGKQVVASGNHVNIDSESSYDGNFTRDFGGVASTKGPKERPGDGEQPEAMSTRRNRVDDHSPYDDNIARHFGYTGTEVPLEDPMEVDRKSSISKYGERPWDLQEVEISPSKQKLSSLMYMGNALRRRRWVTPIQRIETLAPSYPDRLPSLINPAFAGCEPLSVHHPIAAAESEKRCLPPQMTPVFTGAAPPHLDGLWTDGKYKFKLRFLRSTLTP